MAPGDPPAWLPLRRPTWVDVLVGAFAVYWLAVDWEPVRPTPWPWIGVGFVTFLVAVGPAARSRAGRRAGEWFRDVGLVGRAAAILLFAFALWRVEATVGLPRAPTNGIAAGIMAGALVSVVLSLLYYREVSAVGGRSL